MKTTNNTAGLTATESIGVTEMQRNAAKKAVKRMDNMTKFERYMHCQVAMQRANENPEKAKLILQEMAMGGFGRTN